MNVPKCVYLPPYTTSWGAYGSKRWHHQRVLSIYIQRHPMKIDDMFFLQRRHLIRRVLDDALFFHIFARWLKYNSTLRPQSTVEARTSLQLQQSTQSLAQRQHAFDGRNAKKRKINTLAAAVK